MSVIQLNGLNAAENQKMWSIFMSIFCNYTLNMGLHIFYVCALLMGGMENLRVLDFAFALAHFSHFYLHSTISRSDYIE